jgi:para-nitrobenzyl esterase
VLQSPPAGITATPDTATRIGRYLLAALGIEPGDVPALEAVDPLALQAAELAIIEEAQTAPTPERFGELAAAPMPFVPVHGTDLLPRRPLDALIDGAAADVAVLVGSNTEESLIFLAGIEDTITSGLVDAALGAAFAGSDRTGAEAAARYAERLGPVARPHEILAAAESDRMFRVPVYRMADALTGHNPDTWVYEFAWRSLVDGYGAGHFVEVPFVFHTVDTAQGRAFVGPDAPADLADTVHDAWVAFATTGEPRTPRLAGWQRWRAGDPRLVVLDREPRAGGDPRPDETKLWAGVL